MTVPRHGSPASKEASQHTGGGATTTSRMCVTTLLLIATLLVTACAFAPPVGHGSGPPVATLEIVAEDLAFDRDSLEIPAGGVIAVTLENRDPGILHNVAIYPGVGGDPVFRGETFTGIETRTNLMRPLTPGTFRFICDAHPTMSGTLTVSAGE
jgi:plastocyanin